MSSKKPTPMERLVGRPCPPYPQHLDTVMAAFVKADGSLCGRMKPADLQFGPAHLKARRAGWIVAGPGISFGGRAQPIWQLTSKGESEARAARLRVEAAMAARRAWGEAALAAHRAQGQASSDGATEVGADPTPAA